MKRFSFTSLGLRLGFGLLLWVMACSGGAGPGGEGVNGGALDSGNWAAGPVSLPAPTMINKAMVYCDNVPGPTVQCRGDDGAAPHNARIRLTVYPRFASAEPGWSDWLIPTARALSGNVDFCDANAAGGFGQTGDCAVIASAGEKIGICVASGNNCIGSEILMTAPVDGGTSNGSAAPIKALSTTPDGFIIFGNKAPKEPTRKLAFDWSSLLLGNAWAQEAEPIPDLTPAAPTAALCAGHPQSQADVSAAYKVPAGEWTTIKQQKGSAGSQALFRFPGRQDDLNAVNADNIGNINYISLAFKNTLYIVVRETRRPIATIVFPAPIKSMNGDGAMLSVFLEVPKGDPSQFQVAADSFDTNCSLSTESIGLTRPNSMDHNIGQYVPPGEGFHVPIPFEVSGSVGEQAGTAEYLVLYRQEGAGTISPYEGMVFRQRDLLKDFIIVSVTPERALMVVLDPTGKRVVFISRNPETGDTQNYPVSLESIATFPVTMKLIKPFRGSPQLMLLDSGETGAKAWWIPMQVDEGVPPTLNLRAAQSVDLGPIVADTLERIEPATLNQWTTFDRVAGQVKTFVLPSHD